MIHPAPTAAAVARWNWRRGAAVAALVLGGIAAAWIWPAISILTVWPVMLVVPGAALVAWASGRWARLTATGRVGLSIILSVAISAHLVWWLSTVAGGYSREVVFAAAAILAIPLPVGAARARGTPGAWGATIATSVGRAIRRHPGGWLLGLFTAGWVGAVLARGLWQVDAGGLYVGGSNWSDLGVHLSIAQSVTAGNFPPDVPFVAGEPLIYHWFADFHAAILASAANLFAVPVFVVHSAVLAGSLALVVHGLALALVRGRLARRAAFLATLLVILGGGFGWIRLVGDLAAGQGTAWELLLIHAYDNQWLSEWPYFSIPSVMTTGLLVHRATTAGLPLMVGAVLLMVTALPPARRRRAGSGDHPRMVVLSGLAGALLAPFHFFFFPVVPFLVLGWALTAGRLFERRAVRHAALFAAPYVLAVPFALPALDQARGSGWMQLVPGWQTAPLGDGPGAVVFFYATNLGIPVALAIGALALRQAPARAFLALWMAAMFLVPNVVQVSYVSFDMNKFFQAMWIAAAILAGWLLARFPRPALVAILVLSLASPVLASVHTAFSRNYLMSSDSLAAARWIAAETPERSVFVTDAWIISPTDPAGRLRLTTFGPYMANLGIDPDPRLAAVEQIRCGGDPVASAELMRGLGATFVIAASGPCAAPVDFATSPLFVEVYASPETRIYRLLDSP